LKNIPEIIQNLKKMKKIVFVRHGRAEDQASEISDFERSLTIKGKVISARMAKRYREKEKDPGLIITSPAFRALETALIFASEYEIRSETIILNSDLYYNAELNVLLKLLKTINDETDIITLFGHNPAFTQMADRLSAGGCEFMTKSSVACISFNAKKWSEIKPDGGKVAYFLKPE
jgi:phosphohistidine phosphatase